MNAEVAVSRPKLSDNLKSNQIRSQKRPARFETHQLRRLLQHLLHLKRRKRGLRDMYTRVPLRSLRLVPSGSGRWGIGSVGGSEVAGRRSVGGSERLTSFPEVESILRARLNLVFLFFSPSSGV